nr:MAG TPA: hypothetical protein [Caudoviricetes sp.]
MWVFHVLVMFLYSILLEYIRLNWESKPMCKLRSKVSIITLCCVVIITVVCCKTFFT